MIESDAHRAATHLDGPDAISSGGMTTITPLRIAPAVSNARNLGVQADEWTRRRFQVPDNSTRSARTGDPEADDRLDGTRRDRSALDRPLGFHVTLRLEDDRAIATTVPAFRVVSRVALAQGEARGLLAFGAADNHLHALLVTDRVTAGAFARYVETALRWQLGLGARFEPARIRPLRDQRHAYNTLHYAHRQDARHAVGLDPAREGTSLPDLLGLRALGTSLVARVRAHLPRVRREDLVAVLPPGAFAENESFELDVLADAAAAALALPDVSGQCVDSFRARRAAVHAAGREVRGTLLSDVLRIGVRAVQSMRAQPEEPLLVRAVKLQALVRTAMRRSPDAALG